MTATNRIALFVAFNAVGLAGCQPRRTTPAADSASSLAPDAVVGTAAAPSASTTRQADSGSPSALEQSAAVTIVTASPDGRPATGRRCRVHLRRDAMGLATISPLPMGSRSTSPAARATQLEGVIDAAGDHWITLRTTDHVYSLPVGSVLAIEYLDGH